MPAPITVTIPKVTLQVGNQTFGPATLAAGYSLATIDIDRSIANGFNSKPTSTTMSLKIQESDDGGTTWYDIDSADGIVGGITSNHNGQINDNISTISLSGVACQLRASITVAGSSVAIAGSLAIV